MIEPKKIVLICGSSQTVINFRSGLIKTLLENEFIVSVVALDDKFKEDIIKLGVNFYSIDEENRDTNPFNVLQIKSKYYRIIESIRPDIVFTFMLKPNTFGVLAAHKAKVKSIFSMVEGAGDVFINNGIKWKAIRLLVCYLYKKAFRYSKKVFFLNPDDKKEFLSRNLVKEEQSVLINGIGVDTEKFAYKPVNPESNTFLMIARMLTTKGVWDYIKCAALVKKEFPQAQFNYLGAEGTITLKEIQPYIDNGTINYLGTTKDVRPYLEECICYVLPSYYREGLPMSIMEAESVGRAVITTNCVGCKETVQNQYNGFMVKKNDYISMSEYCKKILSDKQMAVDYGKHSRIFCEEHFDQKKINDKLLGNIG